MRVQLTLLALLLATCGWLWSGADAFRFRPEKPIEAGVNRTTLMLRVRRVDAEHPYFTSLSVQLGNSSLAALKQELQFLAPGANITWIVKNDKLLLLRDEDTLSLKTRDQLEVWFFNSSAPTRASTAATFANKKGRKASMPMMRRRRQAPELDMAFQPGGAGPVSDPFPDDIADPPTPEVSDTFPDGSDSVPDGSDPVPDFSDPIPDGSDPIPGTSVQFPDGSDTTPDDSDSDQTPDGSGEIPDVWDAIPEDGSSPSPNTTDPFPGSLSEAFRPGATSSFVNVSEPASVSETAGISSITSPSNASESSWPDQDQQPPESDSQPAGSDSESSPSSDSQPSEGGDSGGENGGDGGGDTGGDGGDSDSTPEDPSGGDDSTDGPSDDENGRKEDDDEYSFYME